MSRPVRNDRTGGGAGSPGKGYKTKAPGSPEKMTGRENTGAGSYEQRSTPMFRGKPQILRDNRGG